jgi:hypothetical protein
MFTAYGFGQNGWEKLTQQGSWTEASRIIAQKPGMTYFIVAARA